RSDVAETPKTGSGQNHRHPIANSEDPSPSSSRPIDAIPVFCKTSGSDMGSLAGPTTLARLSNAPTSRASYPRDDIADPTAKNKRTGRKIHNHNGDRPRTSNYDNTRNNGDGNNTYQRSRVSEQYVSAHAAAERSNTPTLSMAIELHVHVHERESSSSTRRESTSLPPESLLKQQSADSLPGRQAASPSISHNDTPPQGLSLTPSFKKPCAQQITRLPAEESISLSTSHASSQETLLSPKSSPPSHVSDMPYQTKGKEPAQAQTLSERYQTLLLGLKLGFPLWNPSPRRTLNGEYYMPEIGDVGVLSHGLPFNTLFNIAQPLDSPANKDGVPEGLGPPCELQSRWITIEERDNPSQVPLSEPEGAISDQKRGVTVDGSSSIFTYDLSEKEGALLMLPRGSTLWNLENKTPFEKRAKSQWRLWFKYAYGHLNPEDGRALYLVTGVERCSLELTVDSTTGACSWAFPPARCFTKVSRSTPIQDLQPNQESQTVFIRGFRIDACDQDVSLCPPGLSSRPGREKDGNSDGDSNFRRSGSQNPPSSSGDSSSDPSSSSSTSPPSYGGHSGTSNPQSDSLQRLDPSIDKTQILEVELNPSLSDEDSFTHPCKIINNFAFELLSMTKPALLDAGCVAISHDEDWISIVQDSDEELPSNVEIVKRICSEFKFAIDGDIIYTASMTDADKEFLAEKRETSRRQSQDNAISVTVLVVFAEGDDHTTSASPIPDALISQPASGAHRMSEGIHHKQPPHIFENRASNAFELSESEISMDLPPVTWNPTYMGSKATLPPSFADFLPDDYSRYTSAITSERLVGSPAVTEASIARRKNPPRYFCEVPGCPSRGFTSKVNFECKCSHALARRSEALHV
ncbi:hypothetical protein PQX77_006466, partial [Marasmius sp. AFHP31]